MAGSCSAVAKRDFASFSRLWQSTQKSQSALDETYDSPSGVSLRQRAQLKWPGLGGFMFGEVLFVDFKAKLVLQTEYFALEVVRDWRSAKADKTALRNVAAVP